MDRSMYLPRTMCSDGFDPLDILNDSKAKSRDVRIDSIGYSLLEELAESSQRKEDQRLTSRPTATY
jgi:hypothetical protein